MRPLNIYMPYALLARARLHIYYFEEVLIKPEEGLNSKDKIEKILIKKIDF